MTRPLDVINIGDPEARPAPVMPGACASGGCGGPEPDLPPPPSFGEVRVNGVEITPEAIAQEIQHHPAPDAETAWIEAARALAVRELLLQEARRLGIEAEPDNDEAGRAEADDDALVRALLEEEVQPARAGETECRRYYEANRARFRTPDLFEASHILIEPEEDSPAAWAAAEARALTIAAEVGDDPAAFAAAARAFSGCASAQQDGSLGQIRRGELVGPVQAGIEALADGTTARAPVRSRFGWHVLRLQRRIPGHILPFEAVRPRIADMLEARSWSVEAARYVAALAARGDVEGIRIAEGAG
ncbi:peptidylprolyl isomerase [Sphingomonas sp. MAH-20]|uniref:Parvulin-like PPIase n=1 Tax=Sphingomonas horti TaxID=2682842 RepID=A0A6I4J381_9SPHN|nr:MULTISPECIES: peptidylprolyl isomerase [Sphingomonas]MBA2919959.1 peptidylprolyl isomerase [Sphingomonas sp. CGMCC 1.13658]MVO77841.1 peptidylprolyl isomerase [Sphingomonas horti]